MINFADVTKRFPDGTTAVDNLNLDVPDGRITILVGPSGCGKTTTLRMVNRMIEPTSGTIRLNGEDIHASNPAKLRRRIGYVIQHGGLFPHRTIQDNIATVPYLLGWDRKRARRRAAELMDLVGLPAGMARRYPHQLSGGQQQRVGVARALAADPPVLLMDEPFSAVDPVVRRSLQEELLRLQSELRKTILFVTHDIDEAIRLGDMVCVMRTGGHIGQYDTPERLLAAPADDFVAEFLGEDRGVRRLSFINTGSLRLREDTVVRMATPPAEAERIADRSGTPWLLVVDDDHRPAGWLNTARSGWLETAPAGHGTGNGVDGNGAATAPGTPGTIGAVRLAPHGRTFQLGVDSLRSALDSAVLNPSGQAIGVHPDGRVAGTIAQADITAAIPAADADRQEIAAGAV